MSHDKSERILFIFLVLKHKNQSLTSTEYANIVQIMENIGEYVQPFIQYQQKYIKHINRQDLVHKRSPDPEDVVGVTLKMSPLCRGKQFVKWEVERQRRHQSEKSL